MNPMTRATITASAATFLAVAGYLGTRYLAVAVFACIVGWALGWPYIMRIPRPRPAAAIIAVGGGLAVLGITLGRYEPFLRYIIVAIAATTLMALASEVFLPSPRGRVVTSVAGIATGGAVAASGAAWLAADRTPGAADLVVAASVALAVSAIAGSATSFGGLNAILAMSLGTVAGGLTGSMFDSITWYAGCAVGFACAASVVLIHEMGRREPAPRTKLAGISAGLTPVLIAGVLVYIGGRLLIG